MKNSGIQNYLLKLDQSLNIRRWIMTDNADHGTSGARLKYRPIGKIILNKIKTALDQIIVCLEQSTINNASTETCTVSMTDHHKTRNNNSYCIPTYIGMHGPSPYQLQISETRYNPMSNHNYQYPTHSWMNLVICPQQKQLRSSPATTSNNNAKAIVILPDGTIYFIN